MSKVLIAILGISVWFSCGYFGAAATTAHFYGNFGRDGIESKGTAARASLPIFVGGPIGAFAAVCAALDYKPMWDWPRYLLSDIKAVQP